MQSTSTTADLVALRTSVGKTVLENDVKELLDSTSSPLSLSPTQPFPSFQAAVTWLYLASFQRSFTIQAAFSMYAGLKFSCISGEGRTCTAEWEVKEVEVGEWKIVRAHLDHSHDINYIYVPGEDNIESSAQEEEVKRKVGRPRKGFEMVAAKKMVSKPQEKESDYEDFDEDYEDSEEEMNISEVHSRRRQKKTVAKKEVAGKAVVKNRLVFQSFREVSDEIATLQSGRPLIFPTAQNQLSSPTHDSFRILACAAALQQGFSLYLNNSRNQCSLTRFLLKCSQNHSRFNAYGKCEFQIVVVFTSLENGTKGWVVENKARHTGTLCRDILINSSSPSGSSTLSRPRSQPTTPPDMQSLDSPPPKRVKREILLPPIDPSFSSSKLSILQISHLLHSLSPDLVPQASLLHSHGIHTVQAVSNLMTFSRSSMDLFMEDIEEEVDQAGGMNRVQKSNLRKRLEKVRKELRLS